jgi:Double-stranded RNA binding motif
MNYPQAQGGWNPPRKPPGLRGGPSPAAPPPGMPGMVPMPFAPVPNMHHMPGMPALPRGGGGPMGPPLPMPPAMNHIPPHLRQPPMPARLGGMNGLFTGGSGLLAGGKGGMPLNATPGQPRVPGHGLNPIFPTSFDVLQKRSTTMHVPPPEVVVERVGGQDHKPLFRATITWLPDGFKREGLGNSKMEAKRSAATAMLALLDLRTSRPAGFASGKSIYEDRQPQDSLQTFGAPARAGGLLGRHQAVVNVRTGLGARAQLQETVSGWQANAQTNGAIQQHQPQVSQSHAQPDPRNPAARPEQERLSGLLNIMSQNSQFMQQLNSVHGGNLRGGLAKTEPVSVSADAGPTIPPPSQTASAQNGHPPETSAELRSETASAAAADLSNELRLAAGTGTASPPSVGVAGSPQIRSAAVANETKPSVAVAQPVPEEAAPAMSSRPANVAAGVDAQAMSHSESNSTSVEDKAVSEDTLPPKKKRLLATMVSSGSGSPAAVEVKSDTHVVSSSAPFLSHKRIVNDDGFGEMPMIAIPRKRTRNSEPSAQAVAPPTPSQAPPKAVAPAVITAVMFVRVDDTEAMSATVGLAGTAAANALDLQVRAFGPLRDTPSMNDAVVPKWMNVTRVAVTPDTPEAVELSLAFAAGRDASLLESSGGRISIVTTSLRYASLAVPGLVDIVPPQTLLNFLESLQRC